MSGTAKAPSAPPEYEEEASHASATLPTFAVEAAAANEEPEQDGQGSEDWPYPERILSSVSVRAAAEERALRLSTVDSWTSSHADAAPRDTAAALAGTHGDDGQVPPPAYSETYGRITDHNPALGTDASVADDGRVNIRIDQRSQKLSKILVPALRNQLDLQKKEAPPPPPYIPPSLGGSPGELPPPPLNVVIHVVGSRGDVQPFVALGKVLVETYGHRVRLATHPVFKGFVEENGLEFFSIGGDPAELMAFMVKNPGLMPGFDTLRSGDIGKRRKGIAEMIKGCWRSCIEAGDGTGVEASDAAVQDWLNNSEAPAPSGRPFVADAIIANPPSFAHVHCAEKLGIPLHMMFTMPWSPTQAFPHPLANIQSSNAEVSMTNYISYTLVDMLTWQGLGDVINRFRINSLGLEPISLVWAPNMLSRMRIPYTYCWSPALIPKPADWGNHISISGFFFLNLASNYTPDPELAHFLDSGPPPVYIGFGSIVVDDPNEMTRLIFEAVRKTGQRALVSKGWGGLGADEMGIPEGVFMLGNVPHDWLFQRVSAVVHHGGAGTTAAGIAAGKPTVVVPFFGDQPFWGAMVHKAGAGPEPTPYKKLTADILAESIMEALTPESQERAKELRDKIRQEKGADKGALYFHQMLNIDKLRCSLLPECAAVWRVKRTKIRLSALAAYILAEKEVISFSDLKLYRPSEYETDDGPFDPITGGGSAVIGTASTMMMGIADLPVETLKALKIHPDATKTKKHHSKEDGEGSSLRSPSAPSSTLGTTISTQANTSRTSFSTESSATSVTTPGGLNSPQPKSPYDEGPFSPGILSPVTSSEDAATEHAGSVSRHESLGQVGSPRLSTPRGSSMAEALRNLPESSRPGSRTQSPNRHTRRHSSVFDQSGDGAQSPRSPSPGPLGHAQKSFETAIGTGKGLSRIVIAGLKSPMDFSLAVSKGFHNVPKLYGEQVRHVDKVTGIQSGLKAAGKEFGLGMYEGITGLVTQPYAGAQKEGAKGFFKGVGRGIAGISVKPGAGFFAIPGYALKGVYKEIQKHFGSSVDNYIIAARTAQGWEEWNATTPELRKEVVHLYLALLKEAKGKKKGRPDADKIEEAVCHFIERRKQARRERWARIAHKVKNHRHHGDEPADEPAEAPPGSHRHYANSISAAELREHDEQLPPLRGARSSDSGRPRHADTMPVVMSHDPAASDWDDDDDSTPDQNTPDQTTPRLPPSRPQHSFTTPTNATQLSQGQPPNAGHEPDDSEHDSDLDAAIRASVRDSSRGAESEDQLIDRAIRASLAELQRAHTAQLEQEGEEERHLQLALAESRGHARDADDGGHRTHETGRVVDERRVPTGPHETGVVHDEHRAPPFHPDRSAPLIPQAPRLDQQQQQQQQQHDDHDHDEELNRAIAESKRMHDELERGRREEDIVLDYVKRASLAEQEFARRRKEAAGDAEGQGQGQ